MKISNFYKFVIKWNELLTIPIALVLWYFSPLFLRLFDSTAAVYDYGIFQIILFTIIQFLIFHGVAWLIFKITWPKMYNYLDNKLESIISGNGSITTWEKVKLVMWIFSLYLGSMVILSRVIG